MYNPQLDTFIRVADAGSFNRAAEAMYISPPAVIKQINLLEANIGAPLFVRSNRGLRLTEAGRSLYDDAKYIIRYCEEAVARARGASGHREQVIRVGASPMTPAQFLVDLWPKLRAHCPELTFELVPYENTPQNAREILKNLGKRIDVVAGLFDRPFLEDRQCDALEIVKAPIRCAVSVSQPLAEKDRLTPEDLYGQRFMLIKRGWNGYLDAMRDDLWQNHPRIQIVDFDFFSLQVFNQCEREKAAILTIDNWKALHPMLKVLPVDWSYVIPFGLMHAPVPSETVRQFLDAVAAVLREDRL